MFRWCSRVSHRGRCGHRARSRVTDLRVEPRRTPARPWLRAMHVLPEIVDAAAGRAIMVDGSFCRGTDIVRRRIGCRYRRHRPPAMLGAAAPARPALRGCWNFSGRSGPVSLLGATSSAELNKLPHAATLTNLPGVFSASRCWILNPIATRDDDFRANRPATAHHAASVSVGGVARRRSCNDFDRFAQRDRLSVERCEAVPISTATVNGSRCAGGTRRRRRRSVDLLGTGSEALDPSRKADCKDDLAYAMSCSRNQRLRSLTVQYGCGGCSNDCADNATIVHRGGDFGGWIHQAVRRAKRRQLRYQLPDRKGCPSRIWQNPSLSGRGLLGQAG